MSLTGWGRGTWGEGAWNQSVPLAVTGVAGTTALGSPTVQNVLEIPVTGVAGTGAVGTVSVSGAAAFAVTGSAGTSAVGSVTVTGTATFAVTGNFYNCYIGNRNSSSYSVNRRVSSRSYGNRCGGRRNTLQANRSITDSKLVWGICITNT